MSRYLENILQMQKMKAILWESLTFLLHMPSAEPKISLFSKKKISTKLIFLLKVD